VLKKSDVAHFSANIERVYSAPEGDTEFLLLNRYADSARIVNMRVQRRARPVLTARGGQALAHHLGREQVAGPASDTPGVAGRLSRERASDPAECWSRRSARASARHPQVGPQRPTGGLP